MEQQQHKRVWTQYADSYTLSDASSQLDKLPNGIFRLEQDAFGNLLLKSTGDKFTFDYKVYGTEQKFIDRVKKTWNAGTGNMGILLNGTKGTGKSVTAKSLCNTIDLPIIVVPFASKALPTFLNDIHQDLVIFVDEYEKLYNNYDNSILTVMDGVLSDANRRMFILTTNDLHINENMLQRPSRIYYLKTFDNIDPGVLNHVLDDMLENNDFRDDILRFVGEMGIITIDLVKSIIKEVNIHNESPYTFKEIFNVRNHRNELYDLYDVTDPNKPEILEKQIKTQFTFTEINLGLSLYTNHKSYGNMIKIFDRNTALFELEEWEAEEEEAELNADLDDNQTSNKKSYKSKKRVKRRRVIQKEPSVMFNHFSNLII